MVPAGAGTPPLMDQRLALVVPPQEQQDSILRLQEERNDLARALFDMEKERNHWRHRVRVCVRIGLQWVVWRFAGRIGGSGPRHGPLRRLPHP